jgi:hypothetical protein
VNKEIFEIHNLDTEYKNFLIEKNLWKGEIAPSLDRLKQLSLSYYNFENQIMKNGKLIVFDLLAEYTLQIFQKLLALKFPIAKINLTSNYNGDDELCMEDNNTSSFNCRTILGSSQVSLHAYGMAIDINPLQNPYIVNNGIFPKAGADFLDRSLNFLGKIEPIVNFIKSTPFTIWGGEWKEVKDYHHFQLERNLAESLAFSSYKDGKGLLSDLFHN